jgi:hypothetical protein
MMVACWSVPLAVGQDIRTELQQKFGGESLLWFSESNDVATRWLPPETIQEVGIVLDWNAQEVVLLRPEAKQVSRIPGDNVVRVEPFWADPAAEAFFSLYRKQQFKNAVTKGAEVDKLPTLPVWQKRLVRALLIDACSSLGNHRLAGRLFAETLAKDKTPQLLLSVIPLPWGNEVGDSETGSMQALAEDWLISDHEPTRLLGASWMLSGAKRSLALQTLESLSKESKVPMIASYARTQLWRVVPPAEILSERFPGWIAERDRMFVPLQAGPTTLLATRLAQAGQASLALSEWLRIATLHSERYHLSRHANNQAAEALRKMGRTTEADAVEALLAH